VFQDRQLDKLIAVVQVSGLYFQIHHQTAGGIAAKRALLNAVHKNVFWRGHGEILSIF
jgi:hypothetical protein